MKKICNLFTDEEKAQLSYLGSMLHQEPTEEGEEQQSRDEAATRALKAALQAGGFDSIFIHFDPADGIPPDGDWELELYRALRRCDAVLAVVSHSWHASPWCFAEIVLARSLGKRIIMLRTGDDWLTVVGPGPAQLASDSQAITVPDFSDSSL